MRLVDLLSYFSSSPAIVLLRSPNAPFIVDFLHRQFKQAGRISIPHSEFVAALRACREELAESYPGALTAKPESYATDWCTGESRWLQRFLEAGRDEPLYQLTPHTEDVFAFLERALQKDLGFVGTESRLKLVIDTLADLAVGASDDPQTRLNHLREERARIEQEIAQIEADGRVAKYRPAQIRERFLTAVSLLKQLQGDFRAVEDSFRSITAQVQQQQAEGQRTRGGILEFALDAEDLLKQEDQGVSFYEFVRLILSPGQTDRLEAIIREVRRIPELARQQEGMDAVRGMISLLQLEAETVMRTNQRLSSTLRRMLDARSHAERQRVGQLLQEVRELAASLAERPPREDVGINVQLEAAIESPFRRTFWSQPARFERVDLTNFQADENERQEVFRPLAEMQQLDWHSMRGSIRALTRRMHAPTLSQLLEEFPPRAGVVEVIGYLQIARDDGHPVDTQAREKVLLPPSNDDGRWLEVTVPLVTFSARREASDVR